MTILIIIFGALTLLAGIVIVINPEVIFGFLRNNFDKLELHILAVVVRLVLGVLLIYQSNVSKFPFVIEIIGWISIVAAIFLAVMGRRNFHRLMSWALSFVKPFGRVGGALAVAIGAFLIYAFV
ncbi:MAG: PigN domain-containing protein [Candidatus Aureabacteria bacterium]|nr:PigN domain-containing protein [Candidatus Auribacterota bacterium]